MRSIVQSYWSDSWQSGLIWFQQSGRISCQRFEMNCEPLSEIWLSGTPNLAIIDALAMWHTLSFRIGNVIIHWHRESFWPVTPWDHVDHGLEDGFHSHPAFSSSNIPTFTWLVRLVGASTQVMNLRLAIFHSPLFSARTHRCTRMHKYVPERTRLHTHAHNLTCFILHTTLYIFAQISSWGITIVVLLHVKSLLCAYSNMHWTIPASSCERWWGGERESETERGRGRERAK